MWGQGTGWAVHQAQLTPILNKATFPVSYCQKHQLWHSKSQAVWVLPTLLLGIRYLPLVLTF